MIHFGPLFLPLRYNSIALIGCVLFATHGFSKPFSDLIVSSCYGRAFLSENNGSSSKPSEIFKNHRLLFSFPYAILVSNNSYLELLNKDEIQLRVGKSSVFEFLSPTHIDVMQGSFLLYHKNHLNWKISLNDSTISLAGRATWMIEKTKSGDLKIILLEGEGFVRLGEEEKKLNFGELLLFQTSSKNELSQTINLELSLLLATSKLINNYQTDLYSKPRLVSAAKVQIVRLKRRYQALVGGTNEKSELRMWAIRNKMIKN